MKRSIIWRIVLGLVLLLALVLCVFKVILPLFDTADDLRTFVPDVQRYTGVDEGTELTLTGENITFVLDPETTHFTVTDSRTGMVWRSDAPGVADDAATMLNEKQRLQSVLVLDYKNNTGKQTTFSTFAHSVTNSLYTIARVGDTIEVTYTIGDIERTFLYPEAIRDEDMEALLAGLPKKSQRVITDAYKKYDPAKYGKKDDVAALEAAYPELKNGTVIWVIRSKTMKTNAMEKLEAAMIEGGYDADALARDALLVASTGEDEGATKKPVFNVTVVYSLDGDDLVVDVPLDRITYNPDYPPTTLDVLPAFGSAGTDADGYIMVPEGSGAIIRFNNGKTTQNPYYANLYGWDWASVRKEVVSETRIVFPVFGMATGGSSFVCILEEGTAWAGINADVSGRPSQGSYNSAGAEYTLVHGDSYDVSERTNNTVYMFEQQLPAGAHLTQRYCFLPTDSYMDMAATYRDYLLARHPEMHRELSSEAHTVIEMVGAIDKVQQVMGVPTNVPIPMTSYVQATELLEKLLKENLPNLSIRYTGWMNGGMNQTLLNKVRLMSEMGRKKDLLTFLRTASEAGVPVYLDGLTQFARDSGLKEGFLALRDAAQFTTREECEISEYSAIWYGPMDERATYFLIKPALQQKAIEVLSKAAQDFGAAGVAFRDLGGMLSGDYNAKDLVTRQQVLNDQAAAITTLQAQGQKVMVRQGNDYAAVLADVVTDMDFDGMPYRIIDEFIPFYPAALHGSVVYTGVSVNLAEDREELLLRSAEMGAGLQYTLIAANVEEVQDSWFSEYYGADASIIYDDMIASIKAYNEAMSGCFNQKMVAHTRVGNVTVTEYENGFRVYVNYGYTDAELDGIAIPARSFITKEATE